MREYCQSNSLSYSSWAIISEEIVEVLFSCWHNQEIETVWTTLSLCCMWKWNNILKERLTIFSFFSKLNSEKHVLGGLSKFLTRFIRGGEGYGVLRYYVIFHWFASEKPHWMFIMSYHKLFFKFESSNPFLRINQLFSLSLNFSTSVVFFVNQIQLLTVSELFTI